MRTHPDDAALLKQQTWTSGPLCEVCQRPERPTTEHAGAQVCREHMASRLQYARVDPRPPILASAQ